MEKRKHGYLKKINAFLIITTYIFIMDMFLIFGFFLINLFFDYLNPYDYDYSDSIFAFKVLLFFVIFNIVCVICIIIGVICKSLIVKRNIFLFHSIIKLIPSVILFYFSLCFFRVGYKDFIMDEYFNIKSIYFHFFIFSFVYFVVHAYIFILSVITFVLCLLCKKKDMIEIERNLQCPK